MLIENEEHKKYHSLGPDQVYWGKPGIISKQKVVMSFQVVRSTIDSEQISFSIPVFEEDTREMVKDRLGFAMSIVQDRMEDANKAWQLVAQKAEEKAEVKGK